MLISAGSDLLDSVREYAQDVVHKVQGFSLVRYTKEERRKQCIRHRHKLRQRARDWEEHQRQDRDRRARKGLPQPDPTDMSAFIGLMQTYAALEITMIEEDAGLIKNVHHDSFEDDPLMQALFAELGQDDEVHLNSTNQLLSSTGSLRNHIHEIS
ncbi:hypothetical protein P171DRAFT_437958 [Karstenula rhodostoma CBS 690.94]|uniref:Uncharacterized protein n=1 Tax=Karstenula rhodostoma CBS 690.94 TaxID=1392251 RepID=A0A9P4PTP9_9PLEO|nr:hypothetical protein P171DRAFT_437958 [Karstenula rhodostoma CBS 690.94]